ncbi:sortase [Paenibacillus donghaensis]|uniref:Class D sortase n=1 Tax=Paenibacillus donghaensis TaxID=414771 RepID=A0A2Z2KKB1_9BACL|nr:sortase [Paenibacillus donghaensis]ASA24665.1 hypothetical protein B9T62_30275 [Paenibacillus donghaensis]
MKKHTGWLIAVKLVFMLSLVVLVYSIIQVVKAPLEARQAVQEWTKKREEAGNVLLKETEVPLSAEMISFESGAKAGEEAKTDTGNIEYKDGEIFGMISFPRLGQEAAILEGTEEPQLDRGAGHYAGSAQPGMSGNSVLAGHRDTVFSGLGELMPGDLIKLETAVGYYTYEVTGSVIVDADERGAILSSDSPVLTLITCYPFSYVGPAPERYLLTAALIGQEPPQSR